ncbi:MAG: hypothetical protein JSW39_26995, partial [Desulfobacterales bacterium]
MKILILLGVILVLSPSSGKTDTIYFKDGMKTVCQDQAWEEDDEIKCEYAGTVIRYDSEDVLRIQKDPLKYNAKSQPSNTPTIPAPASTVSTQSEAEAKTDGLDFYNPRRPYKYWASQTSKHKTFKEAIEALAQQFDRSAEWVQAHMGDTNDLKEIHRNLESGQLNNLPAPPPTLDTETAGPDFYNPRRPYKYWASQTSKHKTFKEAIE